MVGREKYINEMERKKKGMKEKKRKKMLHGEREVKERELKRTEAHGSDLGHVPFREVRIERCLAYK